MEPLAGLSVVLGALSALLLLSMRVFPRTWARLFAEAGREKGRPAWSRACIVLSISGIMVFWFLHFTGNVHLSLAMAVLGTFLMGRAAQSLILKASLRDNVQVILSKRFATAYVPYTVASLALVVLGLL
jgi:hypothetical protein